MILMIFFTRVGYRKDLGQYLFKKYPKFMRNHFAKSYANDIEMIQNFNQ